MSALSLDFSTTDKVEGLNTIFPSKILQQQDDDKDKATIIDLDDERRKKAITRAINKNRIIQSDFTGKENIAKSAQSESLINFIALKKLEGQVVSVDQEQKEVSIRFHEIGGNNQTVEEAVFDMEEISPSDYDLLEEGAIVYWNIGYLDQPEGRQRISELRFRRMPIWSKREIEKVEEKAKAFKEFFSPELQNKKSNG